MPLTTVKAGERNLIKRVTGKDEVRRFLASSGFVEGESVTVVSETTGNVILNIKDTRVALDKSMANRIMIRI